MVDDNGNTYRGPNDSLHLDSRYGAAVALKNSLLTGKTPESGILLDVYGKQFVDTMNKNIDLFFNSKDFFKGNVRSHDNQAPLEITRSRKLMQYDPIFQETQSALLDERSPAPSVNALRPAFGKFASFVNKNYSEFKRLNIERQGLINYVAHANSVAFTVRELFTPKFHIVDPKEEDRVMKNVTIATTSAALHDSFEELLRNLTEYTQFRHDMIPDDLFVPVRTLTNHYHLILKSEKEYFTQRNIIPNKKQLVDHLKRFNNPRNIELHDHVDTLITFIDNAKVSGDIIGSIKTLTYDLYLSDFFKVSEAVKDFSVAEIKAVDLSYNAHGSDDLNLKGRLGNILKRQSYCDIGMQMKNKPEHVNLHIRELQEDALEDAETIVLSKLLRLESMQEHFKSAVNSMIKLYPVFFTNYTLKN